MSGTDPDLKNQLRNEREPLPKTYPKVCGVCGLTFYNYKEFFEKTRGLTGGDLGKGPKGSVLVYRNCRCGSTITSKVKDLRDYSPEGIRQRNEFGERLMRYIREGKDRNEATQLIKEEMGIS